MAGDQKTSLVAVDVDRRQTAVKTSPRFDVARQRVIHALRHAAHVQPRPAGVPAASSRRKPRPASISRVQPAFPPRRNTPAPGRLSDRAVSSTRRMCWLSVGRRMLTSCHASSASDSPTLALSTRGGGTPFSSTEPNTYLTTPFTSSTAMKSPPGLAADVPDLRTREKRVAKLFIF